jgi:hypothetical protein
MMKHLSRNKVMIGVAIAVLITGMGVVAGKPKALAPQQAEAIVVTPSMMKLNTLSRYHNADKITKTELVELLHAVGFEGKALREAWAIVMKESRGNPLSHNGNRNTGDNSYGLFQVNMIGSLGEERRDKFSLEYNAELLNPVVNAQVAYYMSNGGENWSAWKGSHTKVVQTWLKDFPEAKAQAIARAIAKASA